MPAVAQRGQGSKLAIPRQTRGRTTQNPVVGIDAVADDPLAFGLLQCTPSSSLERP